MRKSILAVSRAAHLLGIRDVYLVGGSVRDALLGRPIKDLDFVTVSAGSSFVLAEKVHEDIRGKLSFFKSYGTSSISGDDFELEFVSARNESYPDESSRNPEVKSGTLLDDLNRRDFTVNSMAFNIGYSVPMGNSFIDMFGGLEDLKRKVIRTVSDPYKTFSDDPLRILRAARFAAQLGFSVDGGTFDAMCHMRDRVSILAKERVSTELIKILSSDNPDIGLSILDSCGVLGLITPVKQGCLRPVGKYKGCWSRMAALFVGIDAESIRKAFNNLRLNTRQKLLYTVNVSRIMHLDEVGCEDKELKGLLLDLGEKFYDYVDGIPFTSDFLSRAKLIDSKLSLTKGLMLNGNDLIEIGISSGPAIGHLIGELKLAVIDGEVNSRLEAENFIRRFLK